MYLCVCACTHVWTCLIGQPCIYLWIIDAVRRESLEYWSLTMSQPKHHCLSAVWLQQHDSLWNRGQTLCSLSDSLKPRNWSVTSTPCTALNVTVPWGWTLNVLLPHRFSAPKIKMSRGPARFFKAMSFFLHLYLSHFFLTFIHQLGTIKIPIYCFPFSYHHCTSC